MPLEEIDLHLNQNDIPLDVKNFLVEADRRIDELFDTERNRKVPRFIPSNAELLYMHLSAIISEDLCLETITVSGKRVRRRNMSCINARV